MKNPRFRKFLSYYKKYTHVLTADLICAFIVGGIVLLYPLLVRHITTGAISPAGLDIQLIIHVTLIFIALMAVEYLANFFMLYWGHVMGARMEFDMRNDIFCHYQKLSFNYYDNARTGQLMSRITNDLFDVTELAHHGPEDVLISIVKIGGSLIILSFVNPQLTLILLLVLPPMLFFALHYNVKMRRAFRRNRERIADINSQIEDSLSGVRVVKSFANEELEIDKFNHGNHRFVESRRTAFFYLSLFHSGLSAFASFMNILAVIGGAVLIYYGRMNIADLLTFMLYINTLIEPVRRLLNFTESFQNGAAGFDRFMEILEVEPDIADAPNAAEIKNVKGKIEFGGVGFRYTEDNDYVFRNLNLVIDPGEYIALVGSSGVGKTTLCSLIPRFYDATEGIVKLDGKNIKSVTMKSLRECIGIVQQDVYLFSGTVRENIMYGKPNASDDEVIAAAKYANAHDFIMELPDGYETNIGQRGVKLSGGQKQRLSIARVFLKDPPVLIFDEATSALDNESEQAIQESFDRLAKGRTTIVIAHRLSTVKNARRIVVLGEDGVAEEGTHSELMAHNGIYARYYNLSAI